ncbi:hypothetical protein JIN85_18945 [Luteolibacter pohnpeiensis]|uniref:DUF4123 domain-containing protein n=1 Tax=Luteolibacter pohnpeiensis TaxID=454153 RepID=A0A934S858_9BACT|nr:hypothetical protein [Luteolibacter pohnpeiensis]MBK1884501.1 hypothetical protein [Luteolibacter pohnpeiensis]
MSALPKFESQVGDEWIVHRYPKVFVREKTSGADRLKIEASQEGTQTMLLLASVLGAPFAALYVLLVPRGGSAEGRYQSPWMSRSELSDLFERFASYWDQDARHHIWLFSDPDRATLVYDQHNVIFAYGPIEDYIRVLETSGYSEAQALAFPAPHTHRYHVAFDQEERDLVSLPGWTKSPLRKGDKW